MREGSEHPVTPVGIGEGALLVVQIESISPQNLRPPATIALSYWDRFAFSLEAGTDYDCNHEPLPVSGTYYHMLCDLGTGRYLARYQPTIAGSYNIELQFRGQS